MKRILVFVLGILVLVVTVAQVKAMRSSHGAATRPQVLPVHANTVSAEGRVVTYPGADVIVGTDVGGTINRVLVDEKDAVQKGSILAVIRADDTRAAFAEAKAHVGEADADIRLFEMEVGRAKSLYTQDVGTKQAWEKSERDLDAARARRASALAAVRKLEAELAKTVITSPIDGTVIARSVQPGETVAAGAALFGVADLAKRRIEAEIDEFDGGHISVGLPVAVSAEGLDGRWRGHVEEVPDSVTYRRLKPQDTTKPTDTRVLLVKIRLDEQTPLKLGQRVDLAIGK